MKICGANLIKISCSEFGGRCAHFVAFFLTSVVFILDSLLPEGVSANSLYSVVVIVAAYCRSPMATFWWAAVCTLASLVASIVAPQSFGLQWEILDRAMTIAAIWLAAEIVYLLRQTREQADSERRRAVEAMEAKGRFLSAASHDLRQPLQSLVLFSGILRERLKGHHTSPIVESMASAIEALRRLLDSVLDLSKLDAGMMRVQRESFPLGMLLQRLSDEYVPRAVAVGVLWRVVPSGLWVMSDVALVERVLRNLLENAMLHAASPKILLGVRRRGDHARIDVIDAGRGIASSELVHIFEEFYQVDNQHRSRELGHGLGLAIVRRVADLLGHQLEVRSNPGRGTRFSLWLPVAPPLTPGAEETASSQSGDRPINVLLVEDDPLVLPAVKLTLEKLGCDVAVTHSGADAIDMAQAHRPALIISDFRLPGLNGIQTISAIRAKLGNPVAASLLTGDFSAAIETQSRRLDIALLRKPVGQEDLARLVIKVRRASG